MERRAYGGVAAANLQTADCCSSYEAVRRVLNAARKDLVEGEGEPAALPPEDAEESSQK